MLKAHSCTMAIWRHTMSIIPGVTAMHVSLGSLRWRSRYRPAPLLSASPARALIDEQISIQGRFLPPHSAVTVCAHMHSEDGDLWEAFSHYNTNEDGTVNLSRDHSVGGSYVGCEPMGLMWSLQPAPGAREGLRLRKKNVEAPDLVNLSLLEGHVTPSDGSTEVIRGAGPLAVSTVERWYMTPGVRRIDIRQNGIVGTLFLPSGPGPFPAMVDLWGMGGGLVEYRSALFASRGFASLSLAYLGHKDIPGPLNTINVGIHYLRSAYHLLQDRPEVCEERVGVIGLSFGVFMSLQIATQPDLKPKCVICINGPIGAYSGSVGQSFESITPYWHFDEQGYVSFREVTLPNNIHPENRVKLENLTCPILCIVGEDDLSCASIENANEIEEALRSADKAQLFTRLSYPGAGHLIEPPYSPNARTSLWMVKPKKLITLWGGHLAPHAAAQENSWNKMLHFLDCNLRG